MQRAAPATLCLQPGKQVAQAEMERATFVVAVVVVFRIVYKSANATT